MIDDALLRPGRLEVHVEINLPDEKGRLQILNIHTRSMREHKRVTDDAVDRLPLLAKEAKNFSGAEIEGLIKSAASFAFNRCIDTKKDMEINIEDVKVSWADLEKSLGEIEPKFGAKTEELETYYRNGIVDYGGAFADLRATLRRMVDQSATSERTPLLTVLLEGGSYTGKTALAACTAVESGFPFVRMITSENMIGLSESARCAMIHRVFMDAYKSQLSLLVIDDIERILEYTPMGPRFSNMVLQTLLVLIKKAPPPGHRLLIVGTTSIPHLLEDLQLVGAFDVSLHVPVLSEAKAYKSVLSELKLLPDDEADAVAGGINKPIGIKQLLMVVELARDPTTGSVSASGFLDALSRVGY